MTTQAEAGAAEVSSPRVWWLWALSATLAAVFAWEINATVGLLLRMDNADRLAAEFSAKFDQDEFGPELRHRRLKTKSKEPPNADHSHQPWPGGK